MPPLPPPPREIDAAAGALLRDAIARAAFDARIFQALGLVGPGGWKARAREAIPRLPTPACGILARFLIIGDALAPDQLEPAIGGPEVLPALERAGLAVREGDGLWRCPFVIIPAAGVLAFSDPIDDPASEDTPDDYILPIGMATRYVDDLAVREPCGLAVDLGCGQGFLALHAASHASRCIASDINPRAVAFARANAALNGVADRIDCRLGSFFEPLQDVAGRIDLLTCNPPFVIRPGGHTTAVVTPMEGDGMLEHLLRATPAMLSEGGWATIIGLWEHPDLADWVSRVRGWLEGSACDALVLQFRTYRPDDYFQQWFAPEVRAAAQDGWRALCERRRIGAITYGGVILRKRLGQNWLRALYTLINVRSGPASDQLRAYFATQTALQSIPFPAALLDRRLRIAPGWRFDPAQPPGTRPPGAPAGLAIPLQHAAQNEQLLQGFDGRTTARETLSHLHQWGRLPVPPEHPAVPGLLQGLVASGCLDIVG